MPLWCQCPFLPRKFQPHHSSTKFATSKYTSQCHFNDVRVYKATVIPYVQTPMLARPPDGNHRAGSDSCRLPGRLHHAIDWKLPPRTGVSLHDRIGQLSWRDFHLLDCSLVDCYLEPFRIHHWKWGTSENLPSVQGTSATPYPYVFS